jgi:hypothetical protein
MEQLQQPQKEFDIEPVAKNDGANMFGHTGVAAE